MYLAADLDGVGSHPAAARWDVGAAAPTTARHWVWATTEASRGGLDLVTIADSHRHPAGEPGAGRLDALMVAMRVAPVTRFVGLAPAIDTTITEPFLVSSQLATLDHVSGGRAGWEVRVSRDAAAGGYVGPRAVPAAGERDDEAAEYVQAVRALWDSWEDDAEIRDAGTHRFLDRERLHHVDFDGRHLAIKGPSITPRPPQGQPVLVIAATGDADADGLAAAEGDVVLLHGSDEPALGDRRRAVTEAAASRGRDPGQLRLLAQVAVVLDDDPGTARERAARLDAAAGGAPPWPGLRFAGTPAQLAERLLAWSELGVDGFRLHPAVMSRDLAQITRRLTPELRARGVLRTPAAEGDGDGDGATLRGRLRLPRPANRHAIA